MSESKKRYLSLAVVPLLLLLGPASQVADGQLEAVQAVLSVVPVTSILATAGLMGVKLAALSRVLQMLGYDQAYLAQGGAGTAAHPIGLQKNYAYMFPYVPGLNVSIRGESSTDYRNTAAQLREGPGAGGPPATRKHYPAIGLPADYESQQKPFRGSEALSKIFKEAGLNIHIPTSAGFPPKGKVDSPGQLDQTKQQAEMQSFQNQQQQHQPVNVLPPPPPSKILDNINNQPPMAQPPPSPPPSTFNNLNQNINQMSHGPITNPDDPNFGLPSNRPINNEQQPQPQPQQQQPPPPPQQPSSSNFPPAASSNHQQQQQQPAVMPSQPNSNWHIPQAHQHRPDQNSQVSSQHPYLPIDLQNKPGRWVQHVPIPQRQRLQKWIQIEQERQRQMSRLRAEEDHLIATGQLDPGPFEGPFDDFGDVFGAPTGANNNIVNSGNNNPALRPVPRPQPMLGASSGGHNNMGEAGGQPLANLLSNDFPNLIPSSSAAAADDLPFNGDTNGHEYHFANILRR